jgi:hypothetical protein
MAVDFVEAIRNKSTAGQLGDMLDLVAAGRTVRGWPRGRAFEHIILRGFELEGADVVWPFEVEVDREVLEQIDGAIYCDGLAGLVEAKDYSDPINIEPIAK